MRRLRNLALFGAISLVMIAGLGYAFRDAPATGFLPDGGGDALGRPAGPAVASDRARYLSDDKAGFIYRTTASEPAAGQ